MFQKLEIMPTNKDVFAEKKMDFSYVSARNLYSISNIYVISIFIKHSTTFCSFFFVALVKLLIAYELIFLQCVFFLLNFSNIEYLWL